MRSTIQSGIEWLGEVPCDWKLERFQWHLNEIKEANNPIKTKQVLSLTNKKGVIPYEEKGAQGNVAKEHYDEYKLAFPGTIVANSMNILIGSVGICNYYGCVSPVYYVFKPNQDSNLEFINYIFQTEPFQKELRRYANGILEIRLRLSSSNILKRIAAFPNIKEQERIVSYLNKKCGEVDALIANEEAQIEKLKEYKQSLITEVVTKGLDSEAPIKDSGVDWVGNIPSEWNLVKIGVGVTKVGSGKTPYGGAETYKSSGILFLRSQNIYDEGIALDNPTFIDESIDEEMKNTRVKPGDVLLNITGGSIGRCCVFPKELVRANVNQHVSIIRVVDTVFLPEYMHYYWLSYLGSMAIHLYQTGGNREGMTADAIKKSPICLMPIEEQRKIVE